MQEAWHILEPNRPLIWSWHYDMLSEYLSLIREKKFKQRFPDSLGLIINVPPRTAKSTFATVCLPDWCWTVNPELRFSFYSYSQDLSTEHSLKRRRLIQSEWYQSMWGDKFKLVGDQNLKTHFDNDKTGQMIATSVGGTATGKGGDILIIDDPLNPEQAASDTERNNCNNWLDNTLRSRMNDMANDVLILVMQRLHEQDPTGYLLDQNPGLFQHICIPLEEEGVKEPWGVAPKTYLYPRSKKVYERPAGDILMADKFPPAAVKSLKRLRMVWAGQFQQRPAPLEGNLIRRADIMFYGGKSPETGALDAPLPERFDMTITSVDCSFKDTKTSDYVCVATIGVKGPNRYILQLIMKHLDSVGTEAEINAQRRAYRSSAVLIEDKANGPAVIASMRKKVPGVIAINPEGGKMSRVYATAPEFQGHNWFFNREAPWCEPTITSLLLFPNGKHDDDVDTITQASVYLQAHGYGLFELYREMAAEATESSRRHGAVTTQDLSRAQRRDQGGFFNAKGRITKQVESTNPDQTDPCPNCGNTGPSRYQEGVNFCFCGTQWTTPGWVIPEYCSTSKVVAEKNSPVLRYLQ